MNGLTIVMIMGMCALPLAGLIILAACICSDIQSNRQLKYFKKLLYQHREVYGIGWNQTMMIKMQGLPVESRIRILEHQLHLKPARIALRKN